jgi:hypothetical protein
MLQLLYATDSLSISGSRGSTLVCGQKQKFRNASKARTHAGRQLEKTQYEVPCPGKTVEIDIYRGPLPGLMVAEVEFPWTGKKARFVPPVVWYRSD